MLVHYERTHPGSDRGWKNASCVESTGRILVSPSLPKEESNGHKLFISTEEETARWDEDRSRSLPGCVGIETGHLSVRAAHRTIPFHFLFSFQNLLAIQETQPAMIPVLGRVRTKDAGTTGKSQEEGAGDECHLVDRP